MIIWQQSRRSGKENSRYRMQLDHGSGTGRNQRRRLHTGCVRGTGRKSAPCGTDPEWAGMVEARDLTEMKVELIRENISRMGFENIRAVQQDATCFDADSEEKADVLIADLPCSGLGVLAKKTDLKYKMNPETETEVAALQREILDTVCRYVKPEGTLMYSTCTISRTENEENAGWFAEKHPEFDLEWEKQIFPSDITDGSILLNLSGGADNGKKRYRFVFI